MNSLLKTLKYCCSIMPYYSVAKGRKVGVFLTWPECELQVKGFTNPVFKKFSTKSEAEQFILNNGGSLGNNSSTGNVTAAAAVTPGKNMFNKRPAPNSNAPTMPKIPKLSTTTSLQIAQMKTYGNYSFPEDADGYVHVYTDGSCEGNGKKGAVAGLGVYFSDGHPLNASEAVSGRATNNCGEIQAASHAIKLAKANNIKRLCINTDSQFLINSITKWVPGWIKRDWKLASGGKVKNADDFKELVELIKNNDITVKWNYVEAHKGIEGNERADVLAKIGGQMYKLNRRK